MFLGEISNPFNIMRVNYDLEDQPKKSEFHSILFAASYIVCRGILLPIAAYYVHYSDVTIWLKLICSCLTLVSLIWLMKILNMTSKKLSVVRYNTLISRNMEEFVTSFTNL